MTLPGFIFRLLDHLGQHDIAGDIREELGSGRSVAWGYWQAGAAIVSGTLVQAATHKWLTLRAAVVGALTFYLCRRLVGMTFPLAEVLTEIYVPVPPEPYMAAAYRWVDGVMVLQPERVPLPWQAALIDPILLYAFNFVAALFAGWVVARLHQRIRFVAICAACLVVTTTMLPSIGRWTSPDTSVVVVTYAWRLRFLLPLIALVGISLGGTAGRRFKTSPSVYRSQLK